MRQMRAVDPLTVEFTLTAPLGDFPVVFAQPLFAGTLGMIISPAALQQYGADVGNHPVGAGPFRVTSWLRATSSSARTPTPPSHGPGSGGFFFYFNFARAPCDDRGCARRPCGPST
ncbi:hypothetical protein ACQPZA_15520 [Pseudonocardia xinjiangensis]|uniref:hypothetical protein n=1 Tax=Pseudonocardia xinjiangensis TaxID=75289 RepID=UPI003D92D303